VVFARNLRVEYCCKTRERADNRVRKKRSQEKRERERERELEELAAGEEDGKKKKQLA
jgi:hypothetical protein